MDKDCSDCEYILKESLKFATVLFVGYKGNRKVKNNSKFIGLGKQKNSLCGSKKDALCSQTAQI